MRHRLLVLCLCALPLALSAQSVDAVLKRMDAAAPNFHALTANIEMLTYTAILDDKTKEAGTLQMQRLKPEDVRAIINFTGESDARELAFMGKKVTIYFPHLNEYQEYDVGKNADVLNQFLLLGFGSSGQDLARSYNITMEGQEKVATQDTSKLLLIPKDAAVKEKLKQVEIWIPNDAAYPVQQQFYEPSGNYRKVTYSNIALNPPLKGALALKLPSGAKKQSQ